MYPNPLALTIRVGKNVGEKHNQSLRWERHHRRLHMKTEEAGHKPENWEVAFIDDGASSREAGE